MNLSKISSTDRRIAKIIENALKGHNKDVIVLKKIILDENSTCQIIEVILDCICDHKMYITAKSSNLLFIFLEQKHIFNLELFSKFQTLLCDSMLSYPTTIKSGLQIIFNAINNCEKSQMTNLVAQILKCVPGSPSIFLELISTNTNLKRDVISQKCYIEMLLEFHDVLPPELHDQIIILAIKLISNIDLAYFGHESPIDELIIEFINFVVTKINEFDKESCMKMFESINSAFMDMIIPSFVVKHVQYILFYSQYLSADFLILFIDQCWKRWNDPQVQPNVSHEVLQYLGSLLLQSKFVTKKTLMNAIEMFSEWALNYINIAHKPPLISLRKRSPTKPVVSQSKDFSTYPLSDLLMHFRFYVLCQTLFDLICKGIDHCVFEPSDIAYIKWDHLIFSPLNPLKYSTPIVTRHFASIMRNFNIFYCDSIIEHNERMKNLATCQKISPLTLEKLQRNTFRVTEDNILGLYYPFKPCNLPQTSALINPLMYEGTQNASYTSIDLQDAITPKNQDFIEQEAPSEILGLSPPDSNFYFSKNPML